MHLEPESILDRVGRRLKDGVEIDPQCWALRGRNFWILAGGWRRACISVKKKLT
jgi:hypothetical protein